MTPTFEEFNRIYAEELARAVQERPDEYRFPADRVPTVAAKTRVAFSRGSYSKEGIAIARTCKRLGIKHTYAAMNAYFNLPKETR